MYMSPCTCGFQDNMMSWMCSLMNEQGGCLQMVARQASQGRLRQEQLAQMVAMRAPNMPSPDRDQAQYRRPQLVHRDAHLERVRSERDTHFVQKEELLAHTRAYSAVKLRTGSPEWSAKRNKYFFKETAEATHRTNEVQEAMDRQFQAHWRQAEAQPRVM